MPDAEHDLIFERFGRGRSTRPSGTQGTGLGLAIVASIAEHHGGTARLVDRPGPGARFEIEVPTSVDPRTH